jgi:hypothetical protein
MLTTTSFEPFFWTLAIYLTIRIVRSAPEARSRLWLALALDTAIGAYAKYSMLLAIAALALGLLMTHERRALATPYAPCALALTALLLAPNAAWQAAHGWPFLTALQGNFAHRHGFANGLTLEDSHVARNAILVSGEQLLYTNPLAVPLWLAGIIAPFRLAALRDLRFIGIAYAVAFLVGVLIAAKGYYIIGIYAALLAIGAVAVERMAPLLRRSLAAAILGLGLLALPLSLPVLPVESLIAYSKLLGLTGTAGTPSHLIQPIFAEEFGWDRLARDVSRVYFRLPPELRGHAAIYADTYGDAGALDFFGPRYELPAAISSQNNYYLWGPRNYDGSVLVAIGATRIDVLRRYYRRVTLIATSTEPYRWIVEGPSPIYLCSDPVSPLTALWPRLRWYGA